VSTLAELEPDLPWAPTSWGAEGLGVIITRGRGDGSMYRTIEFTRGLVEDEMFDVERWLAEVATSGFLGLQGEAPGRAVLPVEEGGSYRVDWRIERTFDAGAQVVIGELVEA
jgi:hypothetical protein